jgi:hypothetical protein
MNFLELVQKGYGISRAGQGDIFAEPDTVANQTGKLREFVEFVAMSWEDIQSSQPSWRFMRREGTLTLPQGQTTVSPSAISDFESIVLADPDGRGRSISLYRESVADEQTVRFVAWGDWQQSYLQRGARGVGQPGCFTIKPDGDLEFDLEADAAYTVKLYYKRSPQPLQQDTDEPIMPAKYHKAIFWWALANYYCTSRPDAKAFEASCRRNLNREMRVLHHEQLDEHLSVEVTA